MRFLVLGVIIAVFLAVVEAKRCRSAQDCADDECCIAKSFLSFRKGNCEKLAQKGDSCSEDDEGIGPNNEQYIGHCPCDLGLSCQPTQVKDLPFIGTVRYDERCVEEGARTTVAKPETETPEPETDAPAE
ncbi:hypothetical protein AVEN_60810-1 [Araneus ventricosus]|uniref:Prokineticin domain-containing protein n=1 Tax=Araneus ventricosus TaxID=182803 RepID=A0A4Y2H6N3_ARAVE|nr:hypothetical protein AVEN_60810-1 [Araneus ventricosus]